MARYIDIEEFSQMIYENFGRDGEYDYRDLIRILREQPTADVKEVVRGNGKTKRKANLIMTNVRLADLTNHHFWNLGNMISAHIVVQI